MGVSLTYLSHWTHLYYLSHLRSPLKIVNYEIIFVRSKGAKAEHTWAYVSIYAASKVQKESIRMILLPFLHCLVHLSFCVILFEVLSLVVGLATTSKTNSHLC